jgi:hypothetical protein
MVEYHILPVPSSGRESVDNDLSTHSNYLEDDDDEIVEIDLTKPIPNHLDTSNSFKRASETPVGWCQIAIIIYQRAIPLALTFSLNNVANFIMLYFAGHLPTSEEESSTDIFAGVSMSLLFSNISCLSIFVGMTGAVETLGKISILIHLYSIVSPTHHCISQGAKIMEPRTIERWELFSRGPYSS